jgi:hypothetical protein
MILMNSNSSGIAKPGQPASPNQQNETWKKLVDNCQKVVQEIRYHLGEALRRYHTLGLLVANAHGTQMRALSKELGPGFSAATLYLCKRFARQFPIFETFTQQYGKPALRDLPTILTKQSRTDSNALENDSGSVLVEVAPTITRIKLDRRVFSMYEECRKLGYTYTFSEFLKEVVVDYFKEHGLRLCMLRVNDGKVEYLDEP